MTFHCTKYLCNDCWFFLLFFLFFKKDCCMNMADWLGASVPRQRDFLLPDAIVVCYCLCVRACECVCVWVTFLQVKDTFWWAGPDTWHSQGLTHWPAGKREKKKDGSVRLVGLLLFEHFASICCAIRATWMFLLVCLCSHTTNHVKKQQQKRTNLTPLSSWKQDVTIMQ